MSIKQAQEDLQRLQQEAARLRSELRDVEERAVKIANFLEMAAVYGGGPSPVLAPVGNRPARPPAPERFTPDEPRLPKNVREVRKILTERRSPMPTKVLVLELEKRGIPTGGKIPVTNLSSALSRFKGIFQADRSEGWSLVEWSKPAEAVSQVEHDQGPVAADAPGEEKSHDFGRLHSDHALKDVAD